MKKNNPNDLEYLTISLYKPLLLEGINMVEKKTRPRPSIPLKLAKAAKIRTLKC